jgi:hypothetical protein
MATASSTKLCFADNLSWPTGICAWNGGVIVAATPDIWFLKDTKGDHHADVRERLFTGFRKYNIPGGDQHAAVDARQPHHVRRRH